MASKLQADPLVSAFTFTGYGQSHVEINRASWFESVLVQADAPPVKWRPQSVSEIQSEDLGLLIQSQAEVLLLGTGLKQVFLKPSLLRGLQGARNSLGLPIGLETMSTQAACRTFNLLAAEGRRVVAAIVIESRLLPENL